MTHPTHAVTFTTVRLFSQIHQKKEPIFFGKTSSKSLFIWDYGESVFNIYEQSLLVPDKYESMKQKK